jgi:3-oxoacyl-[acyl-carrier-protein] synthase-3
MAAEALQLATAGSTPDLLISAGGTPQQIIPCTASLIASEMGWKGISAFDVNASCMGFLAALELSQSLFAAARYKKIAIVCSDISSGGINWDDPESAGILGDGAAAVLLEPSEGMFRSRIEVWPEGAPLTRVRGGGTELPAVKLDESNRSEYLFYMDGPRVFRLASRVLGGVVDDLIGSAPGRWDHVQVVVPHQASPLALRHAARRLDIPPNKIVSIVEEYGNTIAAGMPMALHYAVSSGQLSQGETVAFIGTGAGLMAGGVLMTA